MVKVILTTGISGAEAKGPGDEHECTPAEAKRLIDAGFATPTDARVERAVKPQAEKRGKKGIIASLRDATGL